jgi:hypothetical protein
MSGGWDQISKMVRIQALKKRNAIKRIHKDGD